MKRLTILLCMCLYSIPLQVNADAMLEDAFFSVLFPKINGALEKRFGVLKKYDCPKIVSMNKMVNGTYLFRATLEVIVYEQQPGQEPKPPFQKVSINFNNEDGEWEAKELQVTSLPNSTKLTCRKPV
ncbi:DUF3888 domain-containing protein [Ectobacillus antri]|jgi:hypothetical protein|uniref:DUF3888 domain-containing protein n=2 Tax=Ectobacillus antri TaxID=2486280 RepID=A0ABT6H687_9BACI|nr:DUF3888 domain-containing protein [Ectobacillus antri]MDG4656869.1 DUF3888 domain-containing protein [Ectobacillus antri]MDG5754234.1 DUF3888 domain-containing protein [Ectobacillus antri]